MSELQRLQDEKAAIMRKINALQHTETEKENALLVGKCYKAKNSYGGEDESWWLYTIVHKQLDDGELSITQFEIAIDGKIEITPRNYFLPYQGFIEITHSELSEAWKNTLDAAHGMCA